MACKPLSRMARRNQPWALQCPEATKPPGPFSAVHRPPRHQGPRNDRARRVTNVA